MRTVSRVGGKCPAGPVAEGIHPMIARRDRAPGRWLSCPTEALLRPLLGVGRGVGCGARISDLLPTQPCCPRRGDRRRPLRAGSSGQPLLVVADLQPRVCVQPFFDGGGIEHGAVVGVPFRQGCGHVCGEVAAPGTPGSGGCGGTQCRQCRAGAQHCFDPGRQLLIRQVVWRHEPP